MSSPSIPDAMAAAPACSPCTLEDAYVDGDRYVCANGGHEWAVAADAGGESGTPVCGSTGNVPAQGDTVVVIKDLRVKGSLIR